MTAEQQLPLYTATQPAPATQPTPAAPASPEVPDCHDGVCITCSDEAVEVTVVALLDDDLARVDTGQGIEEISVALVDAAVGARVLVHAKEAIGVIDASGG